MLTPGMQQYYDLKEQHKDSVLFFRMGDFYEMFDEDAVIAHKVLGINITSRNKNSATPTPLAGIPYHALEKYLPVLVKAGYKVAICEQVSDPKLKGIVKREVVRIVTPSTLDIEMDTGSTENNYLVAITVSNSGFGISFLDLSSNNWKTSEFSDFNNLATQLYKISPKEVILCKQLYNDEKIKDILSKKFSLNIFYFEISKNPYLELTSHFGTKSLEAFGIEGKNNAIAACSMILNYLQTNQKKSLDFLNKLSFESFSTSLELDESTIRNLDLIYNFSTKSSTIGTLFGILNQTKTRAGTRYLREQIVKPLKNIEEINKRQNFIEEFLSDKILLDKTQKILSNVSDIDLIMNRIALDRANPLDLINLKNSLKSIIEVINLIKESKNEKLIKIIL